MSQALVDNAADRKQVRHAGRKDRDRRNQELNDLRAVMSSVQGRRLVWRMLSHCAVAASVFDPNNSRMSANSGRQDVGHWLQSEVIDADDDDATLYQTMQREALRERRRKEVESEAVRTQSSTQPGDGNET